VRRLLFAALLSLSLPACEATSSTEVGVRTCLLGILESRGTQQIYEPGGVYPVLPVVNSWVTLPTSQQNLMMNANPNEGDRAVPDDITFKTKDGNNVYIDVNVMWRIETQKAGLITTRVGRTAEEIKERLVRPVSRSVIRDVFNQITSEEYYHVTVKNKSAQEAKELLAKDLAPYGILVDMLQVQQHRFDKEYQAAINAQKQAEADVQTLIEQQKNIEVQKQSELQAKRAEWNKRLEDARGQAGSIRFQADGYYQTKSNQAKAILAEAQAEAEATKKEADALSRLGGDSYAKMQVAKQFAKKKVLLVPASNVSTMNVNTMMDFLLSDEKTARK
jgi:regulator of protease activity HflC (stomatin/prohibitin superfamily)